MKKFRVLLFLLVILSIILYIFLFNKLISKLIFKNPKTEISKRINGSGILNKRNISINNNEFNKINIGKAKLFSSEDSNLSRDNFIITLHQNNSANIEIVGEDNLIYFINFYIVNKTLNINLDKTIFITKPIYIKIPIKDLTEIKIISICSIKSENQIIVNNLKLDVIEEALIELYLKSNIINTIISGSGDIILKGNVKEQKVIINGSGNYLAYNLISDHTDITINGNGKSEINVNKLLNVTINGNGGVYFKGDPEKIVKNINGAGYIIRKYE